MKKHARWIALGAGLAIALAAAALSLRACLHVADRRIQEIAAPHLGCAAEKISVLSQGHSDTSEIYVVEGCGQKATLRCQSPDFICFVERH